MPQPADDRLLRASAEGDLGALDDALHEGADVNARTELGDTALNLAAQNGRIEVVKRLLERGADIENKGGADMTPLMNAAVAGHIGLVRLLLDKRARVGDDLVRSIALKVSILEENAESGMVRPEAVEAWRRFLELLIEARQAQG
jgi:ankyrin repeat protein